MKTNKQYKKSRGKKMINDVLAKSDQSIGDEEARMISEALKRNSILKELNLDSDEIEVNENKQTI